MGRLRCLLPLVGLCAASCAGAGTASPTSTRPTVTSGSAQTAAATTPRSRPASACPGSVAGSGPVVVTAFDVATGRPCFTLRQAQRTANDMYPLSLTDG